MVAPGSVVVNRPFVPNVVSGAPAASRRRKKAPTFLAPARTTLSSGWTRSSTAYSSLALANVALPPAPNAGSGVPSAPSRAATGTNVPPGGRYAPPRTSEASLDERPYETIQPDRHSWWRAAVDAQLVSSGYQGASMKKCTEETAVRVSMIGPDRARSRYERSSAYSRLGRVERPTAASSPTASLPM
jgi:hypothetical protein